MMFEALIFVCQSLTVVAIVGAMVTLACGAVGVAVFATRFMIHTTKGLHP